MEAIPSQWKIALGSGLRPLISYKWQYQLWILVPARAVFGIRLDRNDRHFTTSRPFGQSWRRSTCKCDYIAARMREVLSDVIYGCWCNMGCNCSKKSEGHWFDRPWWFKVQKVRGMVAPKSGLKDQNVIQLENPHWASCQARLALGGRKGRQLPTATKFRCGKTMEIQ